MRCGLEERQSAVAAALCRRPPKAWSDGCGLPSHRSRVAIKRLAQQRAGQVVEKHVLLEKLFSYDDEAGVNAIEIYVHRLRKKLEPGGVRIVTVRGLGYSLEKTAQV